MDIHLIRRRNNLIVRLKGELDHHTSTVFREAIEKELEKNVVQNIILNFNNLTFMDSSGIGVILGRYKKVKDRGGSIVFCGVNKNIEKLLQMGGLLSIIPAYKNENDALKSLG